MLFAEVLLRFYETKACLLKSITATQPIRVRAQITVRVIP